MIPKDTLLYSEIGGPAPSPSESLPPEVDGRRCRDSQVNIRAKTLPLIKDLLRGLTSYSSETVGAGFLG